MNVQFCKHCGKKIDSSGKFCAFCGSLINDLSTEGRQEQKTDTVPSRYPQRVLNSEDKDFNDALFDAYERLIAPLGAIEALYLEYKNNNDKIESLKEVSRFPKAVEVILSLVIAIWGILSLIYLIVNIITAIMIHYMGPDVFLVPIIQFIIPVIAVYVIGRIIDVMRKKGDYKEIDKIYEENSLLLQDADEKMKKISPALQIVPPKYRFSGALVFFTESYRNCRVDNLKEAVREYETQIHRDKIEQASRLVIQGIEDIQFTQEIMIDELERIRRFAFLL